MFGLIGIIDSRPNDPCKVIRYYEKNSYNNKC